MTPEAAVCLLILACAVVLFASERVPADVVALGVMLALIVTGLLRVDQAFAGFASETVMMILGLLIMTAGLAHTGIVDATGRSILEYAGRNPTLLVPAIMLSVAVLSAFMSNTAATAFFIPVVLGFAAKTGTSAFFFFDKRNIPAAPVVSCHQLTEQSSMGDSQRPPSRARAARLLAHALLLDDATALLTGEPLDAPGHR